MISKNARKWINNLNLEMIINDQIHLASLTLKYSYQISLNLVDYLI